MKPTLKELQVELEEYLVSWEHIAFRKINLETRIEKLDNNQTI